MTPRSSERGPTTAATARRASADSSPGDNGGRGEARPRIAILAYGFRPFFLLAAVHAALAMPVWMALLHGLDLPGAPLPPLRWHGHEMIFGFVAAAVAGFLLTAVPSWTGRPNLAGAPLLALALLWLAGRIAVTVPLGLAPTAIAVVDLAFLPALALAVAPSLVRSGQRRNFVVIGFLALLFAANLRFHLDAERGGEALRLALNTVLMMVALIGGRIVPAFTSARLAERRAGAAITPLPLLDGAALAATALVLVVDLAAPDGALAGVIAAAAAVLLALRLARWRGYRTLGQPILWVLHVAYLWLPVALALKSASLLGLPIAGASWIHALTVGAFATMILAVMSRAALGHTGRALVAPASVAVAYVLLTIAALARVFGPVLAPHAWTLWLGASVALWTVAFGTFVLVYAPILWRPRVDGRRG